MEDKRDPIPYATPEKEHDDRFHGLRESLRFIGSVLLLVALLLFSYKPIGRAVNDWLSSIFLGP